MLGVIPMAMKTFVKVKNVSELNNVKNSYSGRMNTEF